MGPIPFAFSVSHFINSVGADAGFASIVGLAILVLLYFAQARETASLRDQAYQASQRADQLEGRLAQLARSPAAPTAPAGQTPAPALQPAAPAGAVRALANPPPATPAPGSGAPAAPAPVMAGAPAPPAGVGAPALSAATRLIPRSSPAVSGPSPAQPIDATTIGALPPATAAGATNPAAATSAAANGAARDVNSPVAAGRPDAAPPRVQIRPGSAAAPGRRAPLAPRVATARGDRGRGTMRVVALLVVGLALAGAVVALLLLTGGSSPQAARTTPTLASNAPAPKHRAAPSALGPSGVTVAVLNGTATALLAHRVSVKLVGSGFRPGTVATASDQTRTATVVAYMPGHRRDALAAAAALKLGPASVQPVDQNTQAIACPPAAPCASNVVVTVGSDLANTP